MFISNLALAPEPRRRFRSIVDMSTALTRHTLFICNHDFRFYYFFKGFKMFICNLAGTPEPRRRFISILNMSTAVRLRMFMFIKCSLYKTYFHIVLYKVYLHNIPVILWFNLKPIAIVSFVALLDSTLCVCYQKEGRGRGRREACLRTLTRVSIVF